MVNCDVKIGIYKQLSTHYRFSSHIAAVETFDFEWYSIETFGIQSTEIYFEKIFPCRKKIS